MLRSVHPTFPSTLPATLPLTRRLPGPASWLAPSLAVALLVAGGCPMGPGPAGDGDGDGDGDASACADAPEAYCFDSRFDEGSSVNHAGQAARHLLLEHLERFIGNLNEASYPAASEDDVFADLNYFYDYEGQGGTGEDTIAIELDGDAEPLQVRIGQLAVNSLKGKLAGIDNPWEAGVIGWGDGTRTPSEVVDEILRDLAARVVARAAGTYEQTPDGADIDRAWVSAAGVDTQELLIKLLGGAVAYSQAADDYLDDDLPGKGLNADHTQPSEEGAPYTALEHFWDEGFGYFGAAHDYDAYTDEEIAGAGGREGWRYGYHDTNGDGYVDWASEVNAAPASYAAKRDLGRCAGSETDFTGDIFAAFLAGRQLIHDADGALSEAQLATLRGHRDDALHAWERALGASTVHYLNEVLVHMDDFGTPAYDFYDHAAHFSELKGFALGLQFNPRSLISREQLVAIHERIGEAPVLADAEPAAIAAYRTGLEEVRAILGEAYGFSADNLGTGAEGCGW